jgi:D-alanyl-D-alanine carboxypeptidase/D-alanyl-D-alanine-endopeptidase (penicillin-binding protein 4)
VDVAGLGQVYRRTATAAASPASTEKLFTTFAALKVLGPSARFSTQVRAVRPRVGTRQPGNLYLVGGGDPAMTGSELDHLAADVAASGIRTVAGQLLVDDYRYDQVHQGPGWKADFVPGDCGPLSALAIDHNGWRTDKAYVADPSAGNLARFRSLLARHGVTVSSRTGRAHVPGGARVVASHLSPTVSTIVRVIDKNSDNFMAELLLKEIGHVRRHAGSTAAGAAAVKDVLAPLGVTVGTLADGSGLSSRNRQTAAGELSLLAAAERTKWYRELLVALPVACKDGTLKKRMCGTAAAGRARAKTGSLDYVRTLSGWTTTADGHLVRFALLLSRYTDATKARAALDAATAVLSAARIDG